jgi:hypothetical protein
MNRRVHARLARQLIEACGGLTEASRECRIGKTQLGDCQLPHGEAFMPADVIFALERYCGQPIYSRALYEARPEAREGSDLRDEASEATEAVAALQHAVREAVRAGPLTSTVRDRLARVFAEAEAELRDVGALLEKDA